MKRLYLVALVAILGLPAQPAFAFDGVAASTASAQTCNITGGSQYIYDSSVGGVMTFGDLKVRIVGRRSNDYGTWIEVDLKVPTGQLSGIQLQWGSPAQKFTMCGQEVSIAYSGGYLTVGVF